MAAGTVRRGAARIEARARVAAAVGRAVVLLAADPVGAAQLRGTLGVTGASPTASGHVDAAAIVAPAIRRAVVVERARETCAIAADPGRAARHGLDACADAVASPLAKLVIAIA